MKLYHVSRDISKIDKFIPKVPKYCNELENKEKRICVSSSIEGCISATSQLWLCKKRTDSYLEFSLFSEAIVYEFNSDDISDGNLITPNELKRSKHIFDAELTDEYWIINQDIVPRKTYVIKLINSSYEDITENFSKEEMVLNTLKNSKLNFTVTKFKNFNYEIIDIEKYKKEIENTYYPFIEKYYNEKKIDGLKRIKECLETEILCRDNCKNEITEIFNGYLGKVKLYLTDLEFKCPTDDDYFNL